MLKKDFIRDGNADHRLSHGRVVIRPASSAINGIKLPGAPTYTNTVRDTHGNLVSTNSADSGL